MVGMDVACFKDDPGNGGRKGDMLQMDTAGEDIAGVDAFEGEGEEG